jgi:hypothetical protein
VFYLGHLPQFVILTFHWEIYHPLNLIGPLKTESMSADFCLFRLNTSFSPPIDQFKREDYPERVQFMYYSVRSQVDMENARCKIELFNMDF